MKLGSLFAGVGGLEMGLEWAGLGETVWQVENDAHGMSEPIRFAFCRRVLERHWPNAERFCDIRDVGANLSDVDIICGGFPCTSRSNAGKRLGITGPQSNLWKEMARVISIKRPRAVVVENVRALRTRGLDVVLADLDALGYQTVTLDIGAWQVGAPHRRDRVFVLGFKAERAIGAAERAIGAAERAEGALWPTPVTTDSKNSRRETARRDHWKSHPGTTLLDAVLLELERAPVVPEENRYPSPSASEYGSSQNGICRSKPSGGTPSLYTRARQEGGTLNARWVEALCGLPIGWTQLDGEHATVFAAGSPLAPIDRSVKPNRWPAGRGLPRHEWEPPLATRDVDPMRSLALHALGNIVVPHCAEVAGLALRAAMGDESCIREVA